MCQDIVNPWLTTPYTPGVCSSSFVRRVGGFHCVVGRPRRVGRPASANESSHSLSRAMSYGYLAAHDILQKTDAKVPVAPTRGDK